MEDEERMLRHSVCGPKREVGSFACSRRSTAEGDQHIMPIQGAKSKRRQVEEQRVARTAEQYRTTFPTRAGHPADRTFLPSPDNRDSTNSMAFQPGLLRPSPTH